MKRAIIYYSFEGNTKEAAIRIGKLIGADLIEVKPVKDIPESGPGKILTGGGKALFGLAAKIYPVEEDLSKYDEFILGTPVWAGRCAPYLITLIKKNEDLRNKITGVFTLSGSGNNKSCLRQLKKRLPNLKNDISLVDRVERDAESYDRSITIFSSLYTALGGKADPD